MSGPLLSIRNLSVGFDRSNPGVKAIDGINLDIRPSECVAIIGESGSGKSVTALASLGLLPPSAHVEGRAIFNGVNLIGLSEQKLRTIRGRDIGYVFQDPMTTLHPLHRVGDQIAEAIRVHTGRIPKKELRDRVLNVMEEVAIPDPIARFRQFPHELSGGLRQRVCVAIAIANLPKLLIADEPTTALDVTVQAKLIETLQGLIEKHEMSLMLISHDLAIVHDLAARVEIFLNGRTVEAGSVEQIIKMPKQAYTRLLIDAVPSLDAHPKRVQGRADGELVQQEPPTVLRAAADTDPSRTPLLELRSVSKHYGKLRKSDRGDIDHPNFAVRDVSLTIAQGECHAIVGESGCGKSTLLKCIAGVLPSTSGEILYGGAPVDPAKSGLPKNFRRDVQMVFQDPYSALHPRMRIFDIIAEPLRNLKVDRSEIETRVAESMVHAHVPADAAGKWPFQFSGGQRQRIGIARALVTRPRFLILDEPVSALDVSVQASVLNLLNQTRAELGLTYIFISHDLGVVNYLADQVSVMKDGRIVETGSRIEVLQRPQHDFTKLLLSSSPGQAFHAHVRQGQGA